MHELSTPPCQTCRGSTLLSLSQGTLSPDQDEGNIFEWLAACFV